ncbi:MAG: hypothetical protein WA840_05765 [Caulobacteraceae bacterium]
MRAFLDFEASSLSDQSYPIEVAWVFEDGQAESHLIRPAAGWTDWDPKAERIHRISRDTLQADGEPSDAVARRLVEALGGHRLFASAPSWDGKWLSVLLRSAGFPRHALRLEDTEVAQVEAIAEVLGERLPQAVLSATTRSVLASVAEQKALFKTEHRALADARMELWTFTRSLKLAERAADEWETDQARKARSG